MISTELKANKVSIEQEVAANLAKLLQDMPYSRENDSIKSKLSRTQGEVALSAKEIDYLLSSVDREINLGILQEKKGPSFQTAEVTNGITDFIHSLRH
jgi:hypothetical protein